MQVDIDTAVGYAIKRAATALRAAMDAELRGHGLSVPQYACLELLAREPGMSNTALAHGAFVTRQAMHQLLVGLRRAGLVAGDGRERGERLSLTTEGAARLRAASRAVALVEERMVAGLDPERRRALQADLVSCAQALGPATPVRGGRGGDADAPIPAV